MGLFSHRPKTAHTLIERLQVEDRMHQARRRGEGLRRRDWEVDAFDEGHHATLITGVIDWCKLTLGECRRPYGVNQFDLILAYRLDEGGREHRLSLKRLQPLDLYQETFPVRLLQLLKLQELAPSSLRLSATLFSWGEAFHQALRPEAQ